MTTATVNQPGPLGKGDPPGLPRLCASGDAPVRAGIARGLSGPDLGCGDGDHGAAGSETRSGRTGSRYRPESAEAGNPGARKRPYQPSPSGGDATNLRRFRMAPLTRSSASSAMFAQAVRRLKEMVRVTSQGAGS
jgi:hypothetical protein